MTPQRKHHITLYRMYNTNVYWVSCDIFFDRQVPPGD